MFSAAGTITDEELDDFHDRHLNPNVTNAPEIVDINDLQLPSIVLNNSSPTQSVISSSKFSHKKTQSISSFRKHHKTRKSLGHIYIRTEDGLEQRLTESEASAMMISPKENETLNDNPDAFISSIDEINVDNNKHLQNNNDIYDTLVNKVNPNNDNKNDEKESNKHTKKDNLDIKDDTNEIFKPVDIIPIEKLDRPHILENIYDEDEETGYKFVTWSGMHDPDLPYNWGNVRKWYYYSVITFTALACTASSASYAAAVPGMMIAYDAGRVAVLVGMTVYVLGFALGPMLFAPLSELYGRSIIYTISLIIFCAFTLGSALAQTLAQQIIFRLLAGCCCSAIITISGGTVVDMFTFDKRGLPMALFSSSVLLGPVIGPIYSSYLAAYSNWRWILWVILIWAGIGTILIICTVPETYGITILQRRAKRLRKETGDDKYITEDQIEEKSVIETLKGTMKRPFVLLFTEPIVLLTSIYMACVYGILYLFFIAYPYVFTTILGLSHTNGALMFIAIGIGIFISFSTFALQRKVFLMHQLPNGRYPPEGRLPFCILSGILFPAALFWFAGTSHSFWVAPALAGIPFGFCISISFLTILTYLVDTYPLYAASVLASNCFLRSVVASVFPLFAQNMFENLGTFWAVAILGFVMIALAPVPFLFWKYGKTIRNKSRYARNDV